MKKKYPRWMPYFLIFLAPFLPLFYSTYLHFEDDTSRVERAEFEYRGVLNIQKHFENLTSLDPEKNIMIF